MKKVATILAVAFLLGFCLVGTSFAAEWAIPGTVVQAGMSGGVPYIVIQQEGTTTLWYATAATAESVENEILATALTAISNGSSVSGVYETSNSTWVDLVIVE